MLPLSHDEVVHGKCSMISKMPGEYEEKFSGLRTFYAYMMAHPGKKLLFMGQEFAQFIEWNYQNELDWLLLDYEKHYKMQQFVKALNNFYLNTPAFWENDSSWDGFSWISNDGRDQSVIAFRRMDKSGGEIIAVCNFVPVAREGYRIGVPKDTKYSVVLNTDDEAFGGTGAGKCKEYTAEPIRMHGYEYSVSLDIPADSVLYLRPEPEGKNKSKKIKRS